MKITMERYGEQGWEFSITSKSEYDEQEHTQWYRTNGEGYGLWQHLQTSASRKRGDGGWEPVYEYQQTEGTGQFSLPTERRAAYAKIRRAWAPEKVTF